MIGIGLDDAGMRCQGVSVLDDRQAVEMGVAREKRKSRSDRGKERKRAMKRNQQVTGEGNGRGNNNHHISHASGIQGDIRGKKSMKAQPRMERATKYLPRAFEGYSFG